MRRRSKLYRVRATWPRASGRRVIIHARGYRDALRIRAIFGGKIL